MKLILKSGEHYTVSQIDIRQWKEAYPSIDVDQQLRNMQMWCAENPRKRKTVRGIRTFIVKWLTRQAERAPKPRTTFAQAHRPFQEQRTSEADKQAAIAHMARLQAIIDGRQK